MNILNFVFSSWKTNGHFGTTLKTWHIVAKERMAVWVQFFKFLYFTVKKQMTVWVKFLNFVFHCKKANTIYVQGLLRNTKLCRTENRYFQGLSKMNEK